MEVNTMSTSPAMASSARWLRVTVMGWTAPRTALARQDGVVSTHLKGAVHGQVHPEFRRALTCPPVCDRANCLRAFLRLVPLELALLERLAQNRLDACVVALAGRLDPLDDVGRKPEADMDLWRHRLRATELSPEFLDRLKHA